MLIYNVKDNRNQQLDLWIVVALDGTEKVMKSEIMIQLLTVISFMQELLSVGHHQVFILRMSL